MADVSVQSYFFFLEMGRKETGSHRWLTLLASHFDVELNWDYWYEAAFPAKEGVQGGSLAADVFVFCIPEQYRVIFLRWMSRVSRRRRKNKLNFNFTVKNNRER